MPLGTIHMTQSKIVESFSKFSYTYSSQHLYSHTWVSVLIESADQLIYEHFLAEQKVPQYSKDFLPHCRCCFPTVSVVILKKIFS